MSPSSLRIIEHTASTLVVVNPPYYSLGALFMLIGATDAIAMFVLALRTHARLPLILAVVIGGSFLLVGVGLVGSRSYDTFSREAGTADLRKVYFGVWKTHQNIPLESIRRAEVETWGPARRVDLILTNGKPVLLSSFTSQQGHHAVADAINDFLGRDHSR